MRRRRAVSLMSTPVPTSSGPTACRITSGDGGMRNFYALHAALWCGLWMVAGCAGPSARDFQIMQASLKAESVQAQRTITDLRAEMQGVQRELGAARAVQARLEGELREAQRRVQEAQRAVEAQREELVRTREERDRLAAISRELQGQLVELGRLRQQLGEAGRDQSRLQALEQAIERHTKELAEIKSAMRKFSTRSKQKPAGTRMAVPIYKDVSDQPALSGESAESASDTVIVERGDTLWGLARTHRVRLSELMAVNNLTSDLILPGQELLLPEP